MTIRSAPSSGLTRFMRAVVAVRELMLIVLMTTVTLLLILLINGLGWFADRVDDYLRGRRRCLTTRT